MDRDDNYNRYLHYWNNDEEGGVTISGNWFCSGRRIWKEDGLA